MNEILFDYAVTPFLCAAGAFVGLSLRPLVYKSFESRAAISILGGLAFICIRPVWESLEISWNASVFLGTAALVALLFFMESTVSMRLPIIGRYFAVMQLESARWRRLKIEQKIARLERAPELSGIVA